MADPKDRSRAGWLVHEAVAVGCTVRIDTDKRGGSVVFCRSPEQAAELARVLNEAKWSPGGGAKE